MSESQSPTALQDCDFYKDPLEPWSNEISLLSSMVDFGVAAVAKLHRDDTNIKEAHQERARLLYALPKYQSKLHSLRDSLEAFVELVSENKANLVEGVTLRGLLKGEARITPQELTAKTKEFIRFLDSHQQASSEALRLHHPTLAPSAPPPPPPPPMLPIKIPTAKTDATVQPAQPPDLDLSARRIPKSVHVQVTTSHAAKDHHSSALAQELRNRKALRKTPLQRTPSGTPQKPKHIFHSDPMMESFQRRMLAIRRAESPDDAAEPAEDGKDSACKECQGSEMHGGYRESDRDEETEVEDSSEDDAPTPKRRVSIEDASDGFDVNELNRVVDQSPFWQTC
ncbi:hypothetical protein HDV03_000688 [Kappamyces sp. JEL0829]|nr:hypothetical protein HDV03_000688 [Kappamyces sp. JEL0829]